MNKKEKIILIITILFGILFHSYFMYLNEILKVADSFAYLQMSKYFETFSIK